MKKLIICLTLLTSMSSFAITDTYECIFDNPMFEDYIHTVVVADGSVTTSIVAEGETF